MVVVVVGRLTSISLLPPTFSIISENEALKSISAFAFAGLPRLTYMWVQSSAAAAAQIPFYRVCVFCLCGGTSCELWGRSAPKQLRSNLCRTETKHVKGPAAWDLTTSIGIKRNRKNTCVCFKVKVNISMFQLLFSFANNKHISYIKRGRHFVSTVK